MQPRALTLTTIPPEILLQIIGQLPTTSLYALSLTSRALSSFLHTHAPTICNTHIQRHSTHSRAASILKSIYVDGWLVPKHSCIVEAEERWQNELASRSVSRASSPHLSHRGVDVRGCCFRADTPGAGSSNSRAPRPRMSRRSHPPRLTIAKSQHVAPCSSPSYQPLLSPITRHTDLSLSLTLGLPSPFKLSRPGPHYLVFLERYSAEIVARWEMDTAPKNPPSDSQSVDDNSIEKDSQFDFMIKLYCLRNWMVLCHNTFITGDRHSVPYAHIGHQEEAEVPSTLGLMVESIGERFKKMARKGKTGVQQVLRNLKRQKQAQPARRLLFGEIDSDSASASSVSSEFGSRTLSQRASSSTAVESDHWVKSLLWFYGVSGQLTSASGAGAQREETLATNHELGNDQIQIDLVEKRSKLTEKLGYRSQKIKISWRDLTSRYKGRFERLDEK